jgi:hypothetical protein
VITAGRAPPITTLAFCRCVELLLGPGRLLLDHFAAGCGLNAAKPFEVAAVLQTQLWLMELLFRRVLLCEDLSVHDEWLAQLAPPPAVVAWLESAAAVAVGLTPPAPSQTGALLAQRGSVSNTCPAVCAFAEFTCGLSPVQRKPHTR